ncbi:MAG: RNA degradosome polyphosphate kinase [Frankiaceae bacterium]|nr:RNA degradosome polyphosphate kinase [Frankiaceae bacterium]MBV9368210.1 RNA degradosome polyphosphate kinase [Frankiales bacterium]
MARYADDLAEELEDLAHERGEPATRRDDRFFDREASWLDYNSRLLELAADDGLPLLERVRFTAIFANNLDEFFMVRVAGLRRRLATGIAVATPTGMAPREQLDLISRRAHELVAEHARVFLEDILPRLREQNICLLHYADLTDDERKSVDEMFEDRVYPVLTPLAVDPAHPFPYISGLSLNLAVVLRDPETGSERFARVKVPPLLPRYVRVDEARFVLLEDVIAAHLSELFPGLDVLEEHTFRVTRNEDLEVEEEDVENLLQALERELLRRRFGPPVRLEVEDTMSDRVLQFLLRELSIGEPELYRLPGPLDLGGLWPIADLDRPSLKQETFVPTTHPRLRGPDGEQVRDIFAALRDGDVVVHHPYDSFATSVQAFVEQAATDPTVLAIKQTLYRTSGDSPVVDALVDAAEAGKQVLVVVEIKARFDEQANISWARTLEQAGCHVVYGMVGLKTHAKLCLVVRQEADGSLRRYVHIGTGNYNPKTARIYEDIGLLTADEAIGGDVADLFNHLSGYTKHQQYDRLLVAPDTLRSGIVAMIRREAEHAVARRPAGIWMKVNSLVDEEVIDALYDAARAGVPVHLIVRGMCALRPGVEGLSAGIRVRSIVGRFLEHSRVFRFANGGDAEVWIGSADMMHRNLDRRVEAMVALRDPVAMQQVCDVLDLALDPGIAGWDLRPDGSWVRSAYVDGKRLPDYQDVLVRRQVQRHSAAQGGGDHA